MSTLRERFWGKVVRDPDTECWEWIAGTAKGYGRISVGGRLVQAHRLAYEWLVGPIPEGLTIDHLCKNTRCMNPQHMEPVPQGVNTLRGNGISSRNARKTHCKNGHALVGDNVRIRPEDGGRICRRCKADVVARHRARRRADLSDASTCEHPREMLSFSVTGRASCACGHSWIDPEAAATFGHAPETEGR